MKKKKDSDLNLDLQKSRTKFQRKSIGDLNENGEDLE